MSIQLAVRIEIIAWKFSMHLQCVPLIFTLARLGLGLVGPVLELVLTTVIMAWFNPQPHPRTFIPQFTRCHTSIPAPPHPCILPSHTSTATFISEL